MKLGKKEAEGCFPHLLQPELVRKTEFNATTLYSAADLGNIEKENSGFDKEAEVKNSSEGMQRTRATRLRRAVERATSSTKPETSGDESAHQQMFAPVLKTRNASCVTDDQTFLLPATETLLTGKKHWFVKQDSSIVPLHHWALLCTHLGQPAYQTNFKEQLEVVMDVSNSILNIVRALLG